jgi:hypothetical protein
VKEIVKKQREEAGNIHCVVCHENQRDTVIVPCNHLCLCSACSTVALLKECPMCRKKIEKLQKIYF